MLDAYLLYLILAATLGLFIWGYWRFDIVAFLALITAVLLGVVPYSQAFMGFSNPAVITVACVMIMTAAVSETGLISFAVKKLAVVNHSTSLHLLTLITLGAALSAFMNNIGALALMMPIAIQTSAGKRSPSLILIPLAFGTVLGGVTTAIGTPPNILISQYRAHVTGTPFAMFDFSPVGIFIAIIGILFLALFAWKLLPERKTSTQDEDLFQIDDYMTEIVIPEETDLIDKTYKEMVEITEATFDIVGMIRKRKKRFSIPATEKFQANDILIIRASHDELEKLLQKGKLQLVEEKHFTKEVLRSEDKQLIEAVVPPGSFAERRSSHSMRLRARYQINLVAISRRGKPIKERLNNVTLRPGDIVLLQGNEETLQETTVNLGFLPLVERGIKVGFKRKDYMAIGLFIGAILLASLQILPVQIAFATAVIAKVIFKVIPARDIYKSVDWSIILLLGALIPIGNAMQTTGAADMISHGFIALADYLPASLLVGLLFLITMSLSDIMNNAATAVIMAPIASGIARALHLNVDPFLMAVAVGASCSFLTPIAHQNNTLVMGPGGYKFFDYFRVGLPLELLILVTATPLILWVWPL